MTDRVSTDVNPELQNKPRTTRSPHCPETTTAVVLVPLVLLVPTWLQCGGTDAASGH